MVANDDLAFGRENRARQRTVIADLNRRVLAEAKHGADIDPSVMPNRNGDRLPAVAGRQGMRKHYVSKIVRRPRHWPEAGADTSRGEVACRERPSVQPSAMNSTGIARHWAPLGMAPVTTEPGRIWAPCPI